MIWPRMMLICIIFALIEWWPLYFICLVLGILLAFAETWYDERDF
jgi:hypothetical protein